jgi:AGCS family alanine or glycine:cation symporter
MWRRVQNDGLCLSIYLILSSGLIFSAVQSNSISGDDAGLWRCSPGIVTNLVIATLAGIVIFGGIRSIANVAEDRVRDGLSIYLLVAIYVRCVHIAVPAVLALIVIQPSSSNRPLAALPAGSWP